MKLVNFKAVLLASLIGTSFAAFADNDDGMHDVEYNPETGKYYYEIDDGGPDGDDLYVELGGVGGTNIDKVNGGATITDSDVTIGSVSGAVHISCGASVANGSTVNCNSTIKVDNLTEEQLASLGGDKGDKGDKGEKGDKGDTGAAGEDGKDGKDGKDADMSIVNKNTADVADLEYKVEIEANINDNQQIQIDQTNDRLTAVQETLYDEGVIRAKSDKILADRIEAAKAESKADDAAQDAANQAARDELVAAQAKTDEAQDVKIADNSQNISDNRDNIINNTVTINKNKAEQDAYNQKMDALYAAHDAKINNNSKAIGQLNDRVSKVETEIAGIHNDIKRLDGMVAANMATSSIVVPSDFNGNLSVGVGVGHYNGTNGLAIGILHDGGNYAVKATVSGTDADDWSNLAYGASVNLTF